MKLVKSLLLPMLASSAGMCAIFVATSPTYGQPGQFEGPPDGGPEMGDHSGPGGGPDRGPRPNDGNFVADFEMYLTKLLTLTAAQQTEVRPLLEQLQTSFTSADSAFTTDFEGLLTSAQRAAYQRGPGVGRGGPDAGRVAATVARLTAQLTLTADQQSETTTLLTELESARDAAEGDFDVALEAILTGTQLTIYEQSLQR